MTSSAIFVLVAVIVLPGVSCSSDAVPKQVVHQGAVQQQTPSPDSVPPKPITEDDFPAFFLRSSFRMHAGKENQDLIDFRLVGAATIGTTTTLFVESSSDTTQFQLMLDEELREHFSVEGSKIELRILESNGREPGPPKMRAQQDVVESVYVGTEVAHVENANYPGTIGCRLTDGSGRTFLLSNNHVLANTQRMPLGTDSFQRDRKIGKLVAVECLERKGKPNLIDAALACTTPSCVKARTPSFLFAEYRRTAVEEGLSVKKWGQASSKETSGKVIAIDGRYLLTLSNGNDYCFKDQIVVESKEEGLPFAVKGDSGSVVVREENNEPVGLFFADKTLEATGATPGGKTIYLVNKMDNVLDGLQDRLPGDLKSREPLKIDTEDRSDIEDMDCKKSLKTSCKFEDKFKECKKKKRRNAKIDGLIDAWIHDYSKYPISLEYSECGEALLITEAKTDVPTKAAIDLANTLRSEAKAIAKELGIEPIEIFVFGENSSMDDVLQEWRRRRGNP